MALAANTRIGAYEVLTPLGAGGMGEVYLARDTRLGRDVALKILPDSLAGDADRLTRFEREAKTLASLNHPNIAQLYGVETADRALVLVMELVEGEDLAQRVSRGPIPIDEALKIARQIATALDAAHERGIVHRDLKPANVKIRDDGTVKVLDFGLAKIDPGASGARGAAGATDDEAPGFSRAVTSPAMTHAGMILGTAAYMAPEQAKGKPVDKRADVWAFGCVLYEMLTAKRAFPGSDVSETLASVLAREVDWSALPAETPHALRALLRACLQKDKGQRLRDLGDAWLYFDTPAPAASALAQSRSMYVPWVVAAAAVIAAAVLGLKALQPVASTSLHLSIALPVGYRVTSGPIISRDGRRIVVAAGDGRARERLFTRELDGFELREVPGTENAERPFFAPDGRQLAYFANGALYALDLQGGSPRRIADAPLPGGGTWGEDGTIVFVPTWNDGLYRVDARGGAAELIIKPDPAKKEYAYASPHFIPGGRELVFASWGQQFALVRLRLPGLEREDVAPGSWGAPVYASSGFLLFPVNEGDVVALPYPRRENASAVAVLSNVHWRGANEDGVMKFAVSDNGTLVYAPSNVSRRSLVLVDEQGRISTLPGDHQMYKSARAAPDGRRAAADINGAIHVIDLDRGTRAPVRQRMRGAESDGIWSPDGTRVYFGTNLEGNWDIYSAVPGRPEAPQRVLEKPLDQFPTSVAPDGTLLFVEVAPGMGGNLWTLSPDGKAAAWLSTPADEYYGVFSPNGTLVAYVSNVSGRLEVYVQPREPGAAGLRVSLNGGNEPAWSAAGDRIYFRQGNVMLSAGIERSPTLSVSAPRVLFDGGWELGWDTPYSVMPDGKHLLMVRFEPEAIPTRLDIVTNWFDELRRRVASGSR